MAADIQFDRSEPVVSGSETATCASCHRPIAELYYSAGGRTFCHDCRNRITAALAERGSVVGGLALGTGGAVLGGAVYYGVAALSGYEIGLIAIVVGWLVGRGMQVGSRSAGGLEYQVAAVVLTYLAIAASYYALLLRGWSGSSSPPPEPSLAHVGVALTLPLRAGLADPPASLLGLAIVAFGLVQAWRMNRKPTIEMQGPFRIGRVVPPAPIA